MKVLFSLIVVVYSVFAQEADSAFVPPTKKGAADYLWITAIPATLTGISAWISSNVHAKQVERFDEQLQYTPNSDIQELRDESASYRNQYRILAGTCFVYSVVAVIVSSTRGDKEPRVKGQPWWMPKEKAVGISASIQL